MSALVPSLSQRLDAVLSCTAMADNREIARTMAAQMSDVEKLMAFEDALTQWVQAACGRRRMVKPVHDDDGDKREKQAYNPSARVRAIRDGWQKTLHTPVDVAGVKKQLRFCTPDDLRTVAGSLRTMATKYTHKADRYDRYAEAVEAKGCDVLGDLTEEPEMVNA